MNRRSASLLLAVAAILATGPADPAIKTAKAPDFKLVVGFYGAGSEPVGVGEIVAFRGRIYQFTSDMREFIVLDFPEKTAEFLDVKHRVQARLPIEKTEALVAAIRRRLGQRVQQLEATDDHANQVSARKTRDLIEPAFREKFDPKAHTLELSNGSVEIHASGVPDPDAARLALIGYALMTLARVNSSRDPESIPPFTRLEAISNLVGQKHLRPTELSFLYRLNGPPEKYRWTYRLEPALKDRDHIGLARLDRFREEAKVIPLADFEKLDRENVEVHRMEFLGSQPVRRQVPPRGRPCATIGRPPPGRSLRGSPRSSTASGPW